MSGMSFIFTCEETLELACGNVVDDLLVSLVKINVISDLSHHAFLLYIYPDLEKKVRENKGILPDGLWLRDVKLSVVEIGHLL